MTIEPGQIYRKFDREEMAVTRIRVEKYRPGDARAHVVDADTGKRFRQILVTQLHDSPITAMGRRRSSGYVLERRPDAVAVTPQKAVITREEYEEQRRRLEADAADAKKAYIRAKSVYDGICGQLRNLRIDWNEQQKAGER